MAIHKLSHYFDIVGNKLTFLSEDIYDKKLDNSVSKWMVEEQNEINNLKNIFKDISTFSIVKDIDERNSLLNTKNPGILVWVEDATKDKTVTSGGAAYLLRQIDNRLVWEKMTESESLDVITNMDSISGKPENLGEVDGTVGEAHDHLNLEKLNKIETENSELIYNGVKLSGITGIDDRIEIDIVGDFTSKMKIVREVILPDINSLSLYIYNYKPLR